MIEERSLTNYNNVKQAHVLLPARVVLAGLNSDEEKDMEEPSSGLHALEDREDIEDSEEEEDIEDKISVPHPLEDREDSEDSEEE